MFEFISAQLSTDQYLTHHWPISCGTMQDEIGSSHMTQGSLTTFIEDRFGNANSALALNMGWAQVPSGIYFDSPEFTISVWVYPQGVTSWSRLIDFGITCCKDVITLVLSTGGPPSLSICSSGWKICQTSQSLIPNKWQFFVGTFNGTHANVYLNGQLNGTLALTYTLPTVVRSSCFIGKSNCPSDGYTSSYLDDLRFYHKSLTQMEIQQLMNQNFICK